MLQAFQAGLHGCGLAGLYVRMRQVRGATIVMYHSVARPEEAGWLDPRNHLDAALFERQVRYLYRQRRVVTMADLVDAVERGEWLPAGTVALTFDDGYLDNLTVAASILARYSLPATLYLPTAQVRTGSAQWIDRLFGILGERSRQRLEWLDSRGSASWNLSDEQQMREAYARITSHLLRSPADERERLLADLDAQMAPRQGAPRLMMTWDDVRDLRRRFPLFEVGVHTRHHVDLSSQSDQTVRAEVEGCIADYVAELGCRPQHFAFPYNRSTDLARRVIREAGLRSAVASGPEVVIGPGADPYALPRIEAPLSMGLLRFRTGGAYPGLSRALTGRA